MKVVLRSRPDEKSKEYFIEQEKEKNNDSYI